ncbi:MAG: chorismate-binding protein [Phycicoccus sp.]|nr:chorismate-binding protein [Phycicoccus sp.]
MTARFGHRIASDVEQVTDDLAELREGFWAVVVTFEGEVTAIRYADVRARGLRVPAPWPGVSGPWRTSLNRTAYVNAVAQVRDRVAAGTVYQVNICRVLTAPVAAEARVTSLGYVLAQGNPAPYGCVIDEPELGVEIACASPELYLSRDGDRLVSRPIKGTATTIETMLPKDFAENVMIVDLVRNDLAHVSAPGSVSVDHLCRPEVHPGLVHLVSDVSGRLIDGAAWPEVFDATFPPGSVSGAPKFTALEAIADLEPVPRGPYCGAIGWIDADAGTAELAVGIRTFWITPDESGIRSLRFGTGAGITWGSDPQAEWEETQLKARKLIALASGRMQA